MTYVELLSPGESSPDNPRWHQHRRAGISASEIAAVMGISPWESPFSLYWRKVNDWRVEDTMLLSAGRHLEAAIAEWWAQQYPYIVVCPAGLYAHPDRPWQLATPDRMLCDPRWHDNPVPEDPAYAYDHLTDAAHTGLLECKWIAYSWDGWGQPGTDDIPVQYRAQALWQLDVLGVDEVHFAALGPGGFRAYGPIRRDETDLAVMRAAGEEFVKRLHAGEPPDLDGHSATLGALKRLYPLVGDGDVEVPLSLAESYAYARAARQEADELAGQCEAEIRAALGDTYARAVRNGKLVASRSVFDQQRIDVARLRAEQPDIAAAYTVKTVVDRLNPGRTPHA